MGTEHFSAIVTETNSRLRLSAAFIAALYIDKDLEYVHTFMNVCFFPRLKVSPDVHGGGRGGGGGAVMT